MNSSIIEKNYRVIVGMGKTGFSCAEFLRREGKSFCLVDTRARPPMLEQFQKQFPDVTIQTGNIDPDLLAAAVEIVMSPGVAMTETFLDAAKNKQIPFVGDIELFFRQARAPVIAISGSNAKSTVTTLVGEMAKASGIKAAVGGNLGTPALELLGDDIELYVLELSSFQLELIDTFSAKVAALLNISEDHMDRYPSLAEYVRAKQNIFSHATTAVYNVQDENTRPSNMLSLNKLPSRKISFGLQQAHNGNFGLVNWDGKIFLAKGSQVLMNVADLKLAGMHNVANCLAALAIGEAADFSMDAMTHVLKTFSGLPHRCQRVTEINGVRYINDSKGTNVGATLAAIEGLAVVDYKNTDHKNIVLIAGGEGKGADFSPLSAPCRKAVKACVLIGRDAKLIAAAIGDATSLVYAMSMSSAVRTAASLATAGDTVLLSPACASFDMFKNYEHRGDCFVAAVHELQAGVSQQGVAES